MSESSEMAVRSPVVHSFHLDGGTWFVGQIHKPTICKVVKGAAFYASQLSHFAKLMASLIFIQTFIFLLQEIHINSTYIVDVVNFLHFNLSFALLCAQ